MYYNFLAFQTGPGHTSLMLDNTVHYRATVMNIRLCFRLHPKPLYLVASFHVKWGMQKLVLWRISRLLTEIISFIISLKLTNDNILCYGHTQSSVCNN